MSNVLHKRLLQKDEFLDSARIVTVNSNKINFAKQAGLKLCLNLDLTNEVNKIVPLTTKLTSYTCKN